MGAGGPTTGRIHGWFRGHAPLVVAGGSGALSVLGTARKARMISVFHKLLFVLLLLPTLAAAEPLHAEAAGCFADWAAAAKTVEQEKLMTVEELGQQVRRQKLGQIVKTDLCQENGHYTYRLVVRTGHGRFVAKTYDARQGIEVGSSGLAD